MAHLNPQYILASGSPRRLALLKPYLPDLQVLKSETELNPKSGDEAESFVRENAKFKAQNVASLCPKSDSFLLIAADTVVSIDDMIVGKPQNRKDAKKYLSMLSGRSHEVKTGLCLYHTSSSTLVVEVETTKVWFRTLSTSEIETYVESHEPYDKAGGYAIQGRAATMIPKIEGCYYNVMGLPLFCLDSMLQKYYAQTLRLADI